MKINKEKLNKLSVAENEEEMQRRSDSRANRDLYKASMKISMKIRRALRLSKMNQTQLAQRMDMDPAALSRLLSGKANLELKTIVRFEKVLGINIIDRCISPYSQPYSEGASTDIRYTVSYSYPEIEVSVLMVSEPWEPYT